MIRAALGLLLALSLMACSSPPTSPTPTASLAGTWTGAVTRADGRLEALRLALREVPAGNVSTMSGTFEWRAQVGTLTGAVFGFSGGGGAALSLQTSTPPSCPGASPTTAAQVSLHLALEGNRLTGDADVVLCGGPEAATVSLTR